MRAVLVPCRIKKSFLGLARAGYLDYLFEHIQDLQMEISELKEYLNIDGKKLVQKKTVADDVLETISKLAPALSGIIEQGKKNTKK